MERLAELGFLIPVIVVMALYTGFASVAFAKKLKIAGIALAILAVAVFWSFGGNDLVKNVLVFFLVLFFMPYTIATWITGIKNRFSSKK